MKRESFMDMHSPARAGVRAASSALALATPTAAVAAPKPLVIDAVCNTNLPCVRITNDGGGSGLRALAKSNSGSVGETLFALPSDPGLGVGIGAVLGLDLSGNATSPDFSACVFGAVLSRRRRCYGQ